MLTCVHEHAQKALGANHTHYPSSQMPRPPGYPARPSRPGLSLVPRPHHAREERVWGHWRPFLGRAHHHVTARAPIQTYANNHMIAELAEPRISANVPRPFPPFGGGVWGRD